MSIVSIVYFSGSGHTEKMAEAVSTGASSVPGTTVRMIRIDAEDIVRGRYENEDALGRIDSSDAVIFGSPTYMGGPAAQFKAFADATGGRWYSRAWRDKLAGGFTVSNSPSGDKHSTLAYFSTLAMQHGMLWVGLGELPMQPTGVNRLGSYQGAAAQAEHGSDKAEVHAADLATGEILGRRVAAFAAGRSA